MLTPIVVRIFEKMRRFNWDVDVVVVVMAYHCRRIFVGLFSADKDNVVIRVIHEVDYVGGGGGRRVGNLMVSVG